MHKSTGPPIYYTYRSWSAIETHAMKLPAHTVFFTDVNAEKVCNSVVTESEKC